jgi:hypothetical protein
MYNIYAYNKSWKWLSDYMTDITYATLSVLHIGHNHFLHNISPFLHRDLLLTLHKSIVTKKQKKDVCLEPKDDIKLANTQPMSSHYHRSVAITDSAPLTSQITVLRSVYLHLYRQVENSD